MPSITHEQAVKLIVENKEELMFIDEFVINIKRFKNSHPGGVYMLNSAIGQDAGKFIAGCSSYDGDILPYKHSIQALEIAKSLAIGQIPYPNNFLIAKNNCNSQDNMV